MDFSFTPEQEELRDQARTFLEANAEPSWTELAGLGWTGVSVAEEHGGAGLGFVEEAVLFEELGRALTPGPYLATVAYVLPALAPADQARVAAGDESWTLALGPHVPGLDHATRVAVVDGDGIWELEGAERVLLETMDATRPLGTLRGGERTRRLADADPWLPVLRRRGRVALALEAVGLARRALELGIEYASERVQFGRRIGSYQAVAHPLATTYMEVELARSLALWAAWATAEDDAEADVAAAAAKSQAADVAVAACERSIQVHGGIGFTWEHVLHRLYKRAQWIQSYDGSPAALRAEVAAAILDGQGA